MSDAPLPPRSSTEPVPGAVAPATLWQGDPREAARQWLRGNTRMAYAEHSVAQYAAMVGSLADWLWAQRQASLLSANTADLDAFFQQLTGRGGKPASLATVKRYRSLVGQLFEHLQTQQLRPGDPTSQLRAPATVHLAADRQAPRLLTAEQSERYIRWVLAQPAQGWCEARDQALRVAYLACGITVNESRQLSCADLMLDERPPLLRIRAHSPVVARRIPLPDWSLASLRHWQQLRAKLPLQSELLFPTRQRSPTAAITGGKALDKPISTSEIYELIRPAMQAAGFDDQQQGPQTLRNSYAARQLLHGVEAEQLQRWMGLHTGFSIEAIRRELDADLGPAPA